MSYKFSTRFPYIKKKKCTNICEDQPVQRIIIPQGLVNPYEITIIEIPLSLQDTPAVIAKPRAGDESYSNFFPVTSSSVRDSQLFPKDSNASASLDASQYSISACASRRSVQPRTATKNASASRAASQNSMNACASRPLIQARTSTKTSCSIGTNIDIKSKSFPRTGHPQMPLMYNSGVTYGGMPCDFSPNRSGTFYKDYIQDYTSVIGPHNESEETGYDYSDPERRAIGFDPYVHGEAFKRQFSQYMNFDPNTRSTPKGYQQSVDSYLNAMDYSVVEPCPPSYLVPNQPLTPYKANHTKQVPGGEVCGRSDNRNSQSGLKRVLDNLDIVELSRIKNDLKNFQLARRKLLFDASNLKH